jgi:hypothetical protein
MYTLAAERINSSIIMVATKKSFEGLFFVIELAFRVRGLMG